MIEDQKAEVERIAQRFNVAVKFVEAGLEARYATTMRAKLEAFDKEEKLIIQDSEAIKKQHEKGRLCARERVGRLLDENSFDELDLRHRPYETGVDIGEEKGAGDGVIVGYGTVSAARHFMGPGCHRAWGNIGDCPCSQSYDGCRKWDEEQNPHLGHV